MLKKISYVLVIAFMASQSSFAATRPADVLGACAKAGEKAQAFQIKGDSSLFTGLRVGPTVGAVTLVDTFGNVFPGQVTLTKNAPYQFILYGVHVAQPHRGDLVAPMTAFYGTSAGSMLYLQQTFAGQPVSNYECELNLKMLATP